jgi:hypothetical protein
MKPFNEDLMQDITKATGSLFEQLWISGTDELAYILGQPRAKTNKEAVRLWIADRVTATRIDMELYTRLMRDLSNILSKLQSSQLTWLYEHCDG